MLNMPHWPKQLSIAANILSSIFVLSVAVGLITSTIVAFGAFCGITFPFTPLVNFNISKLVYFASLRHLVNSNGITL